MRSRGMNDAHPIRHSHDRATNGRLIAVLLILVARRLSASLVYRSGSTLAGLRAAGTLAISNRLLIGLGRNNWLTVRLRSFIPEQGGIVMRSRITVLLLCLVIA